jgi:hypothetical protein
LVGVFLGETICSSDGVLKVALLAAEAKVDGTDLSGEVSLEGSRSRTGDRREEEGSPATPTPPHLDFKPDCKLYIENVKDRYRLHFYRLRLHEYKYPTRAATAGVLSQDTEFANFVKKGAAIYKLNGKEITASKSKEQAKSRMKKDYKEI